MRAERPQCRTGRPDIQDSREGRQARLVHPRRRRRPRSEHYWWDLGTVLARTLTLQFTWHAHGACHASMDDTKVVSGLECQKRRTGAASSVSPSSNSFTPYLGMAPSVFGTDGGPRSPRLTCSGSSGGGCHVIASSFGGRAGTRSRGDRDLRPDRRRTGLDPCCRTALRMDRARDGREVDRRHAPYATDRAGHHDRHGSTQRSGTAAS